MAFSFMPQDNVIQQFAQPEREPSFMQPSFMNVAPSEPSFMQPSAPRQTNVMQMMQPPVQAEVPRKRTSVLDIIGGIADTFAEMGGATPMYQRNVDARTQRTREAELYPLEMRKAQQSVAMNDMEMQQGQLETLTRAYAGLRSLHARTGDEGLRAAMPNVAKIFGLSPEQAQYFSDNPTEAFTVMEGLLGQAKGKTFEVGDNLVRENPDGTVEVVYRGEQKAPKVRQAQLDGPEGPGVYNIDEAGNVVGRVGGIVRAPSAGRQPTLADRRVQYLISQGMDPERAQAIGLGLEPIPGKATTGPLKTVVENRAKQNDAIDTAVGEIDRVLKSEDWQGGSGIGNAVKGTINLVTNTFDGKDLFPDQTRKSVDISNLQQTFVRALSADKRVVNDDFKRLEKLLPGNGVFDGEETARAKLAEVRRFFEEIRKRPLPSDPRLGDETAETPDETPAGADDPLGLFNAD